MSLQKTSRPLLDTLARVGGVLDRAGTSLGAGLRGAARGAWHLLGSRQLYNVLIIAGVMALVVVASCAFEVTRTMSEISRAQQVTSYAVMRQLQAAGMAPPPTSAAPGSSGSAPAPIDPALLDGPRSPARGTFPGPVGH